MSKPKKPCYWEFEGVHYAKGHLEPDDMLRVINRETGINYTHMDGQHHQRWYYMVPSQEYRDTGFMDMHPAPERARGAGRYTEFITGPAGQRRAR